MAFYLIIPSEASLTNISAYRLLAPNTNQIAYNRMGPRSEGSQRLKTGAYSHHGLDLP